MTDLPSRLLSRASLAVLCAMPALALAQGAPQAQSPGATAKGATATGKPVEAKVVEKTPTAAAGAPALVAPAAPATPPPAEAPPAAPAEAPKPEGTRILVLPYQAIYRSVPQKKLAAASELLFKELGQKADVSIVKGAVNTGSTEAKGPSLEGARAAAAEAEKAETERRIEDAVAHWQKAILAMEANAGAITDAAEYVATHHRLARAFMWAGRDKDAQDTLAVVARMAPAYELPALEFSRLYRRWHADAAAAFAKERPAQITVKSGLPGAKVSLDGRPMETAPVLLDKVVAGKHLIVVEVPEVTPFGAVVTVPAGGTLEVRATYGNTLGGSSVGLVTDAIAENAIPTAAVDGATAAGKAANAKFVIFGAMAKDEDKFRVHTFAVDVASAKIAKLEEVAFDLELLTAEADVLKIANAVHGALASFPAGDRQIAQVEKRIRSQSTVTKVDASPELVASTIGEGPKKAKGPRQVLKALKGGTVKIKDEED